MRCGGPPRPAAFRLLNYVTRLYSRLFKYFAKASQMTGVHSSATTSVTVLSAAHTRRQIAIRLLPFVFLLYIANYLDRTSVAYAAIGMARDLGFDDRVLGFGIGIF